MASKSCSAFSNDGKYFANCGNDGILKIWETSTSRLKQEYSPNSHLSLPYSSLTWISVTRQSNTNSVSHVHVFFFFLYIYLFQSIKKLSQFIFIEISLLTNKARIYFSNIFYLVIVDELLIYVVNLLKTIF